jgi:hypothetical protein
LAERRAYPPPAGAARLDGGLPPSGGAGAGEMEALAAVESPAAGREGGRFGGRGEGGERSGRARHGEEMNGAADRGD